ncbi:hypothetical protein C3N37_001338 [Salmonella enterica subsp. enterica serovar Enteritidis]|nr:hypothetical protein [Salmonella enterica subsp. enterica serovar Enteritidis]
MFKRYLWKLCWLAFALVKRGESMKKTYLVVIVLFFISTKVYTLLHNNIFFCRNSPECDLSHVLPDYREQISGTPLKYTLINTAPIPMVTALSQAMRLAKKELTQWNINSFIITGISKRGWTTWLSAIADPDVEAIVPFAIDLLDIDASLEHIYQSYGGNWPITFYPYYQQGIDEKIKSPTFTQLRQIIDPLRYLNTIYQPRLAIPKYIINASGDDFFVPDNTRFYYSKLPGVKSLRIVPNMNHYSINQFAEESLVPFINRFQSKKTLPQLIGLIHHHLLTVYFSEAPVKVVRWTANNPNARDFRYACGIRYKPLTIDIPANNKISITLNEPKTGWEATYIEATFNDGYVATSQVYITPDEKYPQTAPPSVNAACQTLPGRGLGENDSPD